MKPVISLTWLSLFLLIPSASRAQHIIPTKESSGSSENGSISTSNPPSTNTNSSMTTQKPMKIQEATNTTADIALVSNSTTSEAMKASEAQTTTKHTTQKAAYPNSPTSQAIPIPSTTKKAPDTLQRGVNVSTVVKVLVILAVCILVVVFLGRWMILQKNVRDATRRCSQGLLERLRSVVAAMERCLGLSLWPRKENEGEDEEMVEINGEAGAKKVQEEEEEREEGEDSSDDYSSLGGMDLRDRARQSQEEVEWDSEKKTERKMEGAEEELTSVTLGEGSRKGVEDNDLTVL